MTGFAIGSHGVGDVIRIAGGLIGHGMARDALVRQAGVFILLLIRVAALTVGRCVSPEQGKTGLGMIELMRQPR